MDYLELNVGAAPISDPSTSHCLHIATIALSAAVVLSNRLDMTRFATAS
jgi:hypothetical protein